MPTHVAAQIVSKVRMFLGRTWLYVGDDGPWYTFSIDDAIKHIWGETIHTVTDRIVDNRGTVKSIQIDDNDEKSYPPQLFVPAHVPKEYITAARLGYMKDDSERNYVPNVRATRKGCIGCSLMGGRRRTLAAIRRRAKARRATRK